jgi:hypothetical protein
MALKRLYNQLRQPVVLDNGVILAAAGTSGSMRDVQESQISDDDQERYVDAQMVQLSDPPA